MRSFGIIFLNKREVMWGFCHHISMILSCICEQFPKLAPGMSLYIERLRFWLLLSLHLLLTARGFKDFEAWLFSFHGCCHVACFWKRKNTRGSALLSSQSSHQTPKTQYSKNATRNLLFHMENLKGKGDAFLLWKIGCQCSAFQNKANNFIDPHRLISVCLFILTPLYCSVQ